MEPEQGDNESQRLKKRQAMTPHRPAKWRRLFLADQRESRAKAASHLPEMAVLLASGSSTGIYL